MVNKVTQYSNATPGSGSVVNDLQYTYDDWGNLGVFKQDVDSEIGASPSGRDAFQVDYTYAQGHHRAHYDPPAPASISPARPPSPTTTFPPRALDDDASRVTRVKVSPAVRPIPVTQYEYLGVGQVVGTNLLEPQARWNYYETASGGNPYPDLDRFNRVEDSRWTSYKGTGTRDFYSVNIAFDPASNIPGITDYVHKSGAGHCNFDVLYSLDALNRLTRAEEGTLASGPSPTVRATNSGRGTPAPWPSPRPATGCSTASTSTATAFSRVPTNSRPSTTSLSPTNSRPATSTPTRPSTTPLAYDKAGNQTDDGKIYTDVYDAFSASARSNTEQPAAHQRAHVQRPGLPRRLALRRQRRRRGGRRRPRYWVRLRRPVADRHDVPRRGRRPRARSSCTTPRGLGFRRFVVY
ncbi:MAG: hypothetical protein IPM33_10645 [Phycisphaerales bacterium]|nr:hypothetical protein [Phycisphaerales bacterium]